MPFPYVVPPCGLIPTKQSREGYNKEKALRMNPSGQSLLVSQDVDEQRGHRCGDTDEREPYRCGLAHSRVLSLCGIGLHIDNVVLLHIIIR